MNTILTDSDWTKITGKKETDDWTAVRPLQSSGTASSLIYGDRPGDIFRAVEATNQIRLLKSALQQRLEKKS